MNFKNTMNKALSTFLILVALMLHTTLFAQQYPFGATIVVQPPYSPYLSHYADGQDAKLLVVVTPNDNNFVQRECVMQFRIKGQGFECETDVNKLFNLPSIQLVGGMSKTLMSYEYTPYLQPSDLVFKRGALVRGAIPQGLTQISVQIFDKATHLPLSAEHSDVFNLSLSSPPMLNMPFDKENIPVQLFQNINFSWTPLHMGSINAAFSTEYLFELWEIYNEQVPAQQYVQTAQPLYSTTTNSPILIYGPTMPMLIEGKRYAWRVRVQAKKGFDDLELFTNNGYSQVWSFAYAANCPEPSQVLLTSPFPDQIKVQWAYQNTYQQMKISYREAGKSKWYHETTTDPEYYITQLKDNTEYEVKIAGICTGGVETYSQPATIKTQEKGKTQIPNFNCGTPPKKLDLSNKSPLASLNAGETVTAGDFEITITEARGGSGTYSGKGYMRVPYFKLARLAITFQNVQINTSRQLIGGYFQAVYDEANGSIANIGKGVKDIVNNIQGGMSGSTGAGAIVVQNQYNGVIASVNDIQVSSSSVSIGGQSFPREANSTTLIQDKEGNTYGVSETGEKVQVGKQTNEKIPNSGGGYSAGSDPTPLAKDKGSVTFVAHATQKYGFDLLPNPELANNYDKISGISIPWKSVKTAGMDKVSYSGTASMGTLKFRTKAGFEYKPENGVLNIIGTKHGDIQEIYAIAYQDSTHQHVIGKLQAMTLNPIKNVVYVIPTQANQTVDKAKLKAYLDKVYDQAVMHWEVEVISQYKPTITLGDNGLDIAKDESRKDLSPEMKALRDDYLKQGLAQKEDAQTYYVFLVDKFSDASIDGYFPQSKIFGFVRYASSESTLHKTLAHELGHGAGNLEHPFVQYKTTQGATPLLMDYSSGSLLTKQDWGMIHNPGIRTGWNDAVGEGQSAVVRNISALKSFEYKNSYTFLTPSGVPMTLPNTVKEVTFSNGDNYNKVANCGFDLMPFGTLISFVLENGEYYRIEKRCKSEELIGYKKGDILYVDTLSASVRNTKVIIGKPCLASKDIVFNAYQIDYSFDYSIPEMKKNMGIGKEKEYDFLVKSFGGKSVELFAKLDPKYSDEAINYLQYKSNYCGCDNALSVYPFVHAYQISRNPGVFQNCFEQNNEIDFDAIIIEYSRKKGYYGDIKGNYLTEAIKIWKKKDTTIYDKLGSTLKALNGANNTLFTADIITKNLQDAYDNNCLWNALNNRARIRALSVLHEGVVIGELFGLGNNKENIVNALLRTAREEEYESIIKLFTDNPEYFKSYYSKINLESKDEFINLVTQMILKTNEYKKGNPATHTNFNVLEYYGAQYWGASENSSKFVFGKLQHQDEPYGANYDGNTVKIWAKNTMYNSIPSSTPLLKGTFNPFDIVVIVFDKDLPIKGIDGKYIKSGTAYRVPAIWLYWLLDRSNTNKLTNNARIALDAIVLLAAVAASPETGGASLLVISDMTAASADIVITANANNIKNTWGEDGEAFLASWDKVQIALGGVNIAVGGVKFLSNSKATLGISNLQKSIASIAKREDKLKLIGELYNTYVVKLGALSTKYSEYFSKYALQLTKLKNEITALQIQKYLKVLTTKPNFQLNIQQNMKVVVLWTNLEYNIAKFEYLSNRGLLREINWVANGGIVVARLENVSYEDKISKAIKEGDLEIVKQGDEGNPIFGLREVNTTGNIVDDIAITSKELQYLQRFKNKFSSLTDDEFIRAYRRIGNAGFDVRALLQKTQINDDIVRLEKLISYAKNDVQKINNLFNKNLLSGGNKQFIELVDVYLPAFKRQPVSNVKPNYFSQPNRVFDDINMQHIMDKHTLEHFDVNRYGISQDIDMFPIGTTQQQVAAYIDEALTILKNTKGPNYPLNGTAETVKLANGMEVVIGSNLGKEIKLVVPSFPTNANIIGQFYPTKGAMVLKSTVLKTVNEIIR